MKKMIAAFGLVAAILATGCVSTALPPVDRRVTSAEDLGSAVYVTDVRCAKGKSSYATFQANVVNNTSHDLGVEYKVVWLDANGITIDSLVSTWNKVMLAPKDIRALKGTSSSMEAADMLFYVRRLR